MRSQASHQNRFVRFITLPVRFLGKARDLYVRSLTEYAGKVNYGGAVNIGGPTGQISGLPKSFSVGSTGRSGDNEDFRELIRAASTRTSGNRAEIDSLFMQQIRRPSAAVTAAAVPRSCSVGMGRIDEERPCDFAEENRNDFRGRAEMMYPRSRTYAATKRSVVF